MMDASECLHNVRWMQECSDSVENLAMYFHARVSSRVRETNIRTGLVLSLHRIPMVRPWWLHFDHDDCVIGDACVPPRSCASREVSSSSLLCETFYSYFKRFIFRDCLRCLHNETAFLRRLSFFHKLLCRTDMKQKQSNILERVNKRYWPHWSVAINIHLICVSPSAIV